MFKCIHCPASWWGRNICHCASCHRTFLTVKEFDHHQRIRKGKVVCRHPGRLEMVLNDSGVWVKKHA